MSVYLKCINLIRTIWAKCTAGEVINVIVFQSKKQYTLILSVESIYLLINLFIFDKTLLNQWLSPAWLKRP